MAAIGRQGFETGGPLTTTSTTSEPDFGIIAGTPTIETALARISGRCLKLAAVNDAFSMSPAGLALERDYYHRAYLNPSGTPSALVVSLLQCSNGATLQYRVNLTTERKLQLVNSANTTIFTSAVIPATIYTRVEVHVNIPAAGNGTLEMKINGETVFTSAAVNVSNIAPGTFRSSMGSNTGGISVLVDDVGVNDGTGESQNTWLGEGHIIHLQPVADVARTGWEGGAGATTNLWEALDNRPATGKAAAEATDAAQIKDSANNSTDTYEFSVQSYEEGGITSADQILFARGIFRVGNLTAATGNNIGLTVVSNPAIGETLGSSAAAKAEGEPTGWTTRAAAYSVAPSVTLGTKPVLKLRKATATTNAMSIDQASLQVEYVPSAAFALLDSFTRANETPLGNAMWAGPVFKGDATLLLNAFRASGAGSSVWTNSHFWRWFGAEQAVQVEPVALVSSRFFELTARIQNPGTTSLNCYYLAVSSSTGAWELGSVKAGVEATVGTGTKTISTGDKLRLECRGTTIKCIHETAGGTKTTVIEKTNSTVTGAGYIGGAVLSEGTSLAFDNFTGGELIEAGPTKISVTPATETDAAQAIAKRKLVKGAPATEIDAAQTLATKKRPALSPSSETGLAIARGAKKLIAATTASEADTALSRPLRKLRAVTPATETDTAQARLLRKLLTVSPATEVDTAVELHRGVVVFIELPTALSIGDAPVGLKIADFPRALRIGGPKAGLTVEYGPVSLTIDSDSGALAISDAPTTLDGQGEGNT